MLVLCEFKLQASDIIEFSDSSTATEVVEAHARRDVSCNLQEWSVNYSSTEVSRALSLTFCIIWNRIPCNYHSYVPISLSVDNLFFKEWLPLDIVLQGTLT